MNTPSIDQLVSRLLKIQRDSRSLLVQKKTETALANIKRARTFLEKAELTATWAEQYQPTTK